MGTRLGASPHVCAGQRAECATVSLPLGSFPEQCLGEVIGKDVSVNIFANRPPRHTQLIGYPLLSPASPG